MSAAGTAGGKSEDKMAELKAVALCRRSTDIVNFFGTEKPAEMCMFASSCSQFRSPTPTQDRLHAAFSKMQRHGLWSLIFMILAMTFAILVFIRPSFAQAQIRDNSAQQEHSSEQDRRLDWNAQRVDKMEQRLAELEQQVNRMIGFGGGLGCLAIFLQLVQLLNQRTTANQMMRVVQEKETKSAAGGR